jgi:arsenite methyltransferase
MSALQFDEEGSRRLEATYTTPDIVEQRRAILSALDLRPGERVLDLGVGPGLLAAEIAVAVGAAGAVCGIDLSDSMIALARRRELPPGAAALDLQVADVRSLPFERAGFDVAVSTQVYEYVADIEAALAEARRVLRPGGRLLVLDTDWDSLVWRSNDEDRMRRVLDAWDEHLADPHLPRRLTGLLEGAGLRVQARAVVPLLNAGYRTDSYSAGLIETIARFVPGRRGVTDADARAWAADLVALGDG